MPILLIIIGFIWLVFYFIIIPYIFDGRTFCKILFKIILYKQDNQKIKLLNIIIRESILIFIPWIIGVVVNAINFLIFKINFTFDSTNYNQTTILLIRLSTTFYFLWYLFIILGVYIDRKNQLYFDFKMNIYVLKYIEKIKDINNTNNKTISHNENHVHLLKNQPGNLDENVIKELEEIESEI